MKKFLSLLLALTMLLTLCSVASAEAGVFTGVGDSEIGGKGAIEVAVTVDENGAVTAIEVTKNGDTVGISDPAVAQIPGLIVEQQTANVDAVAGATKTSDAIMAAVLDAVTKAGLDTVKWSTKVETVVEKAEDVTIETEIVVIGGGGAGLAAAVQANQLGSKVLVLEKMGKVGGNTILAGGALQTISTLGSMLYGERDFYGLRKMLSLLSKYAYALVAALMAGLFCFSAPFLNSYGIAAEPDTVLSLRIMLLSLPFLWLNDLLARLYPSVQRQRLSVLLLTLQNVVLKILLLLLCVAAISRLHWRSIPAVAVWCLLVELLSPAVTLLREKRTCGNVALLGLEDQADRSCHSFSITGKAENVADIHREIDLFCQQNGISRNKGVLLAIAFEEAALNTINHNEHVSMIDICLLLEEGSLIVRIRDDGAPFDPLAFVDDEDILQMNNIRLLERLTDQKTYTRIMNMNNTVLSLRLEAAENDGANDGTC